MVGFQILRYLLDNPSVYHLEFQEPKINVTDFLPILRIIFVSLGCNFIIFGGNFHSDYWSAHPLNRLYWQHEGPMLSYFCCLCVMFYYPQSVRSSSDTQLVLYSIFGIIFPMQNKVRLNLIDDKGMNYGHNFYQKISTLYKL